MLTQMGVILNRGPFDFMKTIRERIHVVQVAPGYIPVTFMIRYGVVGGKHPHSQSTTTQCAISATNPKPEQGIQGSACNGREDRAQKKIV